jgi:hypothetical protein
MLSGQKYFRIYKIYPTEIKLDYDAGGSILEYNRKRLKSISEEDRYAMWQQFTGELKSELLKKAA